MLFPVLTSEDSAFLNSWLELAAASLLPISMFISMFISLPLHTEPARAMISKISEMQKETNPESLELIRGIIF